MISSSRRYLFKKFCNEGQRGLFDRFNKLGSSLVISFLIYSDKYFNKFLKLIKKKKKKKIYKDADFFIKKSN